MTGGDEIQLLADGINAARAGEQDRARELLTQVLAVNVGSELAWLWMSSVLETPQQRRDCLLRVLTINPYNDAARRGLAQLDARPGSAEAEASPPAQSLKAPATDPAVSSGSQIACPFCAAQTDSANLDCVACGENITLSCPSCDALIYLWETTRCPCGEGLRHYIFFPDGIDHEGLGQRYAMASRWEAAARQWDRALNEGSHRSMLHRKLAQAYDHIGRASEAQFHRNAASQ